MQGRSEKLSNERRDEGGERQGEEEPIEALCPKPSLQTEGKGEEQLSQGHSQFEKSFEGNS